MKDKAKDAKNTEYTNAKENSEIVKELQRGGSPPLPSVRARSAGSTGRHLCHQRRLDRGNQNFRRFSNEHLWVDLRPVEKEVFFRATDPPPAKRD